LKSTHRKEKARAGPVDLWMVKNWKTGTHFLREGEISPQIVRAGGRLTRDVPQMVV